MQAARISFCEHGQHDVRGCGFTQAQGHGPIALVSADFELAVPEASLDVTFLFHKSRSMDPMDRFQLFLRAFCKSGRQVTRAAAMLDRIEMLVDDTRLVIGKTNPGAGGVHFRPQVQGKTHQAARLCHILAHHSDSFRMRIGDNASPDMLAEFRELVLSLHMPSAVIINASQIILTQSEFRAIPVDALATLPKAKPLPSPNPRYRRPKTNKPSEGPSIFSRSSPRTRLFNTKDVAETLDTLDQIRGQCDAMRQYDNLVRSFRQGELADCSASPLSAHARPLASIAAGAALFALIFSAAPAQAPTVAQFISIIAPMDAAL